MEDIESGERVIGCLPGETPFSLVLISQARRYEAELDRLRALVAKRERQLIEAVTGGIWFDNLSDEVARSTDDGVRRVEVVGVISDAGLLAAVDEATGDPS